MRKAVLFVCISAGLISSETHLPFVSCDLRGQLGNQLFQIATTLAYAWDHHAYPIFPVLEDEDNPNPVFGLKYNRERIFFRLDASKPTRPFMHFYGNWEAVWHDPSPIPFYPDLQLRGYQMSWRRFDHYRERLLEIFAPSAKISAYLKDKYGELIAHPKTVALHVRTYSLRLHNSKQFPFLGLEYYRKAMELFPVDAVFVVFSDRINWCKKHFSQLAKTIIYIENNDRIEDFFLMSMMKHQIIANSTFSWWAAYLNKNPDKIVVAPSSYMHPDIYAYPLRQPNDFYLPNWQMVRPDYDQPYPEDMTLYDTTQSSDGN